MESPEGHACGAVITIERQEFHRRTLRCLGKPEVKVLLLPCLKEYNIPATLHTSLVLVPNSSHDQALGLQAWRVLLYEVRLLKTITFMSATSLMTPLSVFVSSLASFLQ